MRPTFHCSIQYFQNLVILESCIMMIYFYFLFIKYLKTMAVCITINIFNHLYFSCYKYFFFFFFSQLTNLKSFEETLNKIESEERHKSQTQVVATVSFDL